jgi:hypothetical protein
MVAVAGTIPAIRERRGAVAVQRQPEAAGFETGAETRAASQRAAFQQGRHLGLSLLLQSVEEGLERHQIFLKGKMHVQFRSAKLLRKTPDFHREHALKKERP